MTYIDIIKQRKGDFDAAFEFARNEASAIRTGRASSSLVEDILVEYMGSKLKIKELGTITIPEPRLIQIQPWDKSALALIEKAIREQSSIGLNPVVDGNAVRLTIPPLMEERRKELIRVLHQKVEEARVRVRQIREGILKRVQDEVRAKTAREDDLRRAKDEVQKTVDELNRKFDELTKKKEQELMTS